MTGAHRVTSHLVERSDAAWRGVGEEAAVQHHGPAQQVEPQEHGQSQDDLQLRLRQRQTGPGVLEVGQQAHRVGVDGHGCQLQGDQSQAVGRHGDAPILCADVVDVELPEGWEERVIVQLSINSTDLMFASLEWNFFAFSL